MTAERLRGVFVMFDDALMDIIAPPFVCDCDNRMRSSGFHLPHAATPRKPRREAEGWME